MRVTRLLFAVAVVLAASVHVNAFAPVPPAKGDDPLSLARKGLDEVSDFVYQNRSLNDVVADLKDRLKIPVLLDSGIYQFGIDPSQPTITTSMKQTKTRDGLKAALAGHNLKFGLVREGLYISTEDGVISRQLRQRVTVDCNETAFGTVVKQLGTDTGANVVLDPRLGEKAAKAVTLKLDEVPLETAVRLLSEVADLRAIRMSNVLFVTTGERAEKLRADADGPVQPSTATPGIFPGNAPPGFGVIGGFGGAVALPAPVAGPPAVEAPPVEKKEENKP
jgi:hypothetical protein